MALKRYALWIVLAVLLISGCSFSSEPDSDVPRSVGPTVAQSDAGDNASSSASGAPGVSGGAGSTQAGGGEEDGSQAARDEAAGDNGGGSAASGGGAAVVDEASSRSNASERSDDVDAGKQGKPAERGVASGAGDDASSNGAASRAGTADGEGSGSGAEAAPVADDAVAEGGRQPDESGRLSSGVAAEPNAALLTIVGNDETGTVLEPASVELRKDDKVIDVLKRATRAHNIQLGSRGSGMFAYVEGIASLYEFDDGPESGWVFRVNGELSAKGAGVVKVGEGDYIEWLFTNDLGKSEQAQ